MELCTKGSPLKPLGLTRLSGAAEASINVAWVGRQDTEEGRPFPGRRGALGITKAALLCRGFSGKTVSSDPGPLSNGNLGSWGGRKEPFLNLPGFDCVYLKTILVPRWHILGWKNLFPFVALCVWWPLSSNEFGHSLWKAWACTGPSVVYCKLSAGGFLGPAPGSGDWVGSDFVSFTPDLGSQTQSPRACTLRATLPFAGFNSFIFLVDKYFFNETVPF